LNLLLNKLLYQPEENYNFAIAASSKRVIMTIKWRISLSREEML